VTDPRHKRKSPDYKRWCYYPQADGSYSSHSKDGKSKSFFKVNALRLIFTIINSKDCSLSKSVKLKT
jgi:hypothetical protein